MKKILYVGWIAIGCLSSCKTVKLPSSDSTPPIITDWRVLNVNNSNTVIYKGSNNEITVNYNEALVIFCWAQDSQGVKSVKISGEGKLNCFENKNGTIYTSNKNINTYPNPNISSPDKDGKVPVELATNVSLKVKDFACAVPNHQPSSGYITLSGTATNYYGGTSSISTLKIKFSK